MEMDDIGTARQPGMQRREEGVSDRVKIEGLNARQNHSLHSAAEASRRFAVMAPTVDKDGVTIGSQATADLFRCRL
jgi:hypothetical protein